MEKLPVITEKNLVSYFDKAEIIRQVLEQIGKDLDMSFPDIIPGKGAHAYQEIAGHIEGFVGKLIYGNYQKLMHFLYRIDVSERAISEVIENSGQGELAKEISRLIIKRELQKVLFRNYYQ